MSQLPNFGDTLSGGIQEVSALLPLLGTEQCERHVGTALEKGYLFAAATPLSIFGSLGIVKTAFATLLATTTKTFYGGRWLSDAGFGTTGSVASMVTLVEDTKQYGAEVQLQRLMKEQHIDDPELVKSIEWYGWRKSDSTDSPDENSTDGIHLAKSPPSLILSWNASLILSSMILSVVAITPYLYLIHNHWGRALLWVFPILRAFGSFLCVVSVQLALQIRIHRITTTSLLVMKARKRYPLKIEEAIQDRETLLELRLRKLQDEVRDELGRTHSTDLEKQLDRNRFAELQDVLDAHSLSEDALMLLLQAALVLGMAMIIAGYVGCFNMVSRTDAPNGPYVWFGMETSLAVVRIALWGWNPPWDEGHTGMTMHLKLRSRDLTSHTPLIFSDSSRANVPVLTSSNSHTSSGKPGAGQLIPGPSIPRFPLITTPQSLSHLTSPIDYAGYLQKEHKESFIAANADDFLASATAYVGPLPRLGAEEFKDILLYYAIVPDVNGTCERKLLCMTACRNDSQWASVSVFIDGDMSYTAFTSHSQDFPGTRALKVALENEVQLDSVETIDHQTLNLLVEYSFRLFSRLCTVEKSGDQLPLSWNVTLPSSLHPAKIGKSIPLTESDKEYIRTRQIHDLKSDYCIQRGNLLLGVFSTEEEVEWGLILESAVMEVYLCILERSFVQPISPSPTYFRPLVLEWVRGMEDRISLDKESCRRRWSGPTDVHALFMYEATYDVLLRELRSLRQAPTGSTTIRRWREIIAIITDRPDQLPPVSELFELPLLKSLEYLSDELLSLFTVKGRTDIPTPVYCNMIAYLRSSLSRLRDTQASSLYNRIDPHGPGSPEFCPPYTQIRQVSEQISRSLSLQSDSVQFLEINFWDRGQVLAALRLLDSLPPSLSLTSVYFYEESFDNQALQLLTSILQRRRRILCLLLDDCGSVDRTNLDQSIAANRRKWKEEARNGGEFTYSMGFDLIAANRNLKDPDDSQSIAVYHHDIVLTNRADVFAMVHIPRPGKVVLNLSVKPHNCDINLVALLTRSVGKIGAPDNDYTVRRFKVAVSDSSGFHTVSVEGFPELETGCYELRIRLENDVQYLFRDLAIDFIPSSAVEVSIETRNGIQAAEGATMIQEAGEAKKVTRGEEPALETSQLGSVVESGSESDVEADDGEVELDTDSAESHNSDAHETEEDTQGQSVLLRSWQTYGRCSWDLALAAGGQRWRLNTI
ncbi:hypothetical protein AAF712_004456 [Marasmius tenuissimus]|uniref:Uncharacterized protein n=1 Tax=Marasmius tenuissimus TaxID=585030 RepID=A0ABR3A460_9AGAR